MSGIIYAGPSELDGKPIVAIAITSSANAKTGNMVQTYIIRSDIDPRDASKSGADSSVCGSCIHRGKAHADPDRATAKERSCYVLLGQGPLQVYKAYKRGAYRKVNDIAALGDGRMVRIGTYGDGLAVPQWVWNELLSKSIGHTAYTHQLNSRPEVFMTSADSLPLAQAAWAIGERTFRTITDIAEVQGNEILCPASEEMGRRTTCLSCKLCSGNTIKAKNIAIVVHGSGAGHYDGSV